MNKQFETRQDFVAFEELYGDIISGYLLIMDQMDSTSIAGFEGLYLNPGSSLKKFSMRYRHDDLSNTKIPRGEMTSALESLTGMESIINDVAGCFERAA